MCFIFFKTHFQDVPRTKTRYVTKLWNDTNLLKGWTPGSPLKKLASGWRIRIPIHSTDFNFCPLKLRLQIWAFQRYVIFFCKKNPNKSSKKNENFRKNIYFWLNLKFQNRESCSEFWNKHFWFETTKFELRIPEKAHTPHSGLNMSSNGPKLMKLEYQT